MSKAVHRSERSLSKNRTRKKEIIQHPAVKHRVIQDRVMQPKPNVISEKPKKKIIEFYQLNEISSVASGKRDVVITKLSGRLDEQNPKMVSCYDS